MPTNSEGHPKTRNLGLEKRRSSPQRSLRADPSRSPAIPVADAKDRYGRTLAYVYLEDGRLLNLEMIRSGFATAYTRFAFSKADEFKAAEREANRSRLGIWSSSPQEPSRVFEDSPLLRASPLLPRRRRGTDRRVAPCLFPAFLLLPVVNRLAESMRNWHRGLAASSQNPGGPQ